LAKLVKKPLRVPGIGSPVTRDTSPRHVSACAAVGFSGNPAGLEGSPYAHGPAPDAQCIAYASRVVECLPRRAPYQQYFSDYCATSKEHGLELDGRAYLAAIEAYIVCVANADCADFQDPGPCQDASIAAGTACPNLYAETTTGGT